MVYTRVEANSTNIARSFFPRWDVNLFASLLEKTRGSIVDKCKRDGGMLGETNPGEYCAGSQHAERDIKHFLVFFSTRLLTEFLAKASKRVHPLGFSLPFAIHRFDTGRSLFQNTRYIPPPPPPLPGIDGREHCEGTRGYAVALTRVYTYDFSIGLRDIFPSLRLPPSLPSTPSSAALLLAILFPIGPRRDSPILIKRISRHQFRVPWSLSRYKLRAAIYPRKLWMFVRISLIPSPKPSSRFFRFLFFSSFFLSYDTWSTPDQYLIEGVSFKLSSVYKSSRFSNFVSIIRGISC